MRIRGIAIAWTLGLGLALAAPTAAVDWSSHADERVIRIVTTNEDGGTKTTKIWLAVIEGQAYIRTGGTRWGKNVEREADVQVQIGESTHDLRVEFVSDEETRVAVVRAFREKYGWSDRMISPFRGSSPLIMRLQPR